MNILDDIKENEVKEPFYMLFGLLGFIILWIWFNMNDAKYLEYEDNMGSIMVLCFYYEAIFGMSVKV